jgi:hypothetical protein
MFLSEYHFVATSCHGYQILLGLRALQIREMWFRKKPWPGRQGPIHARASCSGEVFEIFIQTSYVLFPWIRRQTQGFYLHKKTRKITGLFQARFEPMFPISVRLEITFALTRPATGTDCFRSMKCIMQGVPGGKVNILGGHSIGHSKQKSVYVHVSYSERFPR